jgi:hypothetical protein
LRRPTPRSSYRKGRVDLVSHGLRLVRSMEEECKWRSFLVLSMPVKSVSSVVRARRKMVARRTTTAASGSASSVRWRFLTARFSAWWGTAGDGGVFSLLTAFFSVLHVASNYPQTAWLVSLSPRIV